MKRPAIIGTGSACNLLTFGLFVIVTAGVPCKARLFESPEGSVRLDVASGRPIVSGVFLNGQGPYRFLLDTGAQTNLVEASIARQLGLAPTFQTEVDSAAGKANVPGGRIAEVSLGWVTASDQQFLFSILDVAQAVSPDIQGILGEQFLAGFDYLLDFPNHRLVIGGAAPEGGSRVSIESINGCPAIATSEGRLVLDSGTDTTVLLRAPSSTSGHVRTATGQAFVSKVQSLSIVIAGRE
jgi:hypothetical protein